MRLFIETEEGTQKKVIQPIEATLARKIFNLKLNFL